MKSMTGYGKGQYAKHNRKFTVEIKSVNNKYKEVNIRLPKLLNYLETEIRHIISEKIARGKVDVYINFESYAKEDLKMSLDKNLLNEYYNNLKNIKDEFNLEDKVSLSLLATYPNVISMEQEIEDEEQVRNILTIALEKALEDLIFMRKREGDALKTDMQSKCLLLSQYVQDVEEEIPNIVEEYKKNLKKKIEDVLEHKNYDENRILMEVAILTDKTSVDEEITRLKSHIQQFKDTLEEILPIGRKLDFLTQEMNREINTIGSKSNSIKVSKSVIMLKTTLEKLREQVQNIE